MASSPTKMARATASSTSAPSSAPECPRSTRNNAFPMNWKPTSAERPRRSISRLHDPDPAGAFGRPPDHRFGRTMLAQTKGIYRGYERAFLSSPDGADRRGPVRTDVKASVEFRPARPLCPAHRRLSHPSRHAEIFRKSAAQGAVGRQHRLVDSFDLDVRPVRRQLRCPAIVGPGDHLLAEPEQPIPFAVVQMHRIRAFVLTDDAQLADTRRMDAPFVAAAVPDPALPPDEIARFRV